MLRQAKTLIPLIGLLAAACEAGEGKAPTTTAAGVSSEIKVATAGPMTGLNLAAFGEQMKRGADLAVADINAAGGVLGKQLVLEIGDDRCEPRRAVGVAKDLVGKAVVFVAGHFCSSSSIPASEVYAEANVLQITPASTNPALTDDAAAKGWTHVFRTVGRDDFQGVIAGRFIADNYRGNNVAIVHDRSAYGKVIADMAKRTMNAAGLQEAMYEAISQGDEDFSVLVSKMKAAKIDVIYAGLYATEAGLLIRQAREQGLNAQLISEDALVDYRFWSIAGDAAQGTLMTFQPAARKLDSAKAVVAKFWAEGYDPEGYTLYTYAAFQVWKAAVEKAGTTDAKAASQAIRGQSFDTVLGTLTYDQKGDIVDPAYVWWVWRSGRYVEVQGPGA